MLIKCTESTKFDHFITDRLPVFLRPLRNQELHRREVGFYRKPHLLAAATDDGATAAQQPIPLLWLGRLRRMAEVAHSLDASEGDKVIPSLDWIGFSKSE